jgi:hypothetical protein
MRAVVRCRHTVILGSRSSSLERAQGVGSAALRASDGKWFFPSPPLVSPRRATALEPAAGCRSGGRPRFSLVAHPRSARRAGRVSRLAFGSSSWRVASARCNAGKRAAVPVPSRCEDSEALAKRQEREPSLRFPDPRRVFSRTEARAGWSAAWAAGQSCYSGQGSQS